MIRARLAVCVPLLLLASTWLGVAGCGGGLKPTTQPVEIEPYYEYFVGLRGRNIYLLPTLDAKQAFDRDPTGESAGPYTAFVDLTGRYVLIAGDPELVERIRVAYERGGEAELLPALSLEAPPPDEAATLPSEKVLRNEPGPSVETEEEVPAPGDVGRGAVTQPATGD